MIAARRLWELTREERDEKVKANRRKFAEMDDATLALQLRGMLVIFPTHTKITGACLRRRDA